MNINRISFEATLANDGPPDADNVSGETDSSVLDNGDCINGGSSKLPQYCETDQK